MKRDPYKIYKQISIETAPPVQLTLMMFNSTLKFIRQAKMAMSEKDYEQKNHYIQKAIAIIQQLNRTLDMKFEISTQMRSIYEYMIHRLIEANFNNDYEKLEEIEGLVRELRDAWKEVSGKVR